MGEGFGIVEISPDALSFFPVDDGRARILANGELTLCCNFCIAQERQCHIFIVVRGLGIFQNLGHLGIVGGAEQESYIAESLIGQACQGFGCYFQNCLTFELAGADAFFCQQIVLRVVLAELEHRSILEFWCLCHNAMSY